MKIRFVGEIRRTNSFGTFEPGKVYDVSDAVGEQLLTVPPQFESADKKKQAATADKQITEVKTDEDAGGDYTGFNMKDLRAEVRKRGLVVRRNARKSELAELLGEDDKTEKVKNGDSEGGNI